MSDLATTSLATTLHADVILQIIRRLSFRERRRLLATCSSLQRIVATYEEHCQGFLQRLPNDVLHRIFLLLAPSDIFQLVQTCWHLRLLVLHFNIGWHRFRSATLDGDSLTLYPMARPDSERTINLNSAKPIVGLTIRDRLSLQMGASSSNLEQVHQRLRCLFRTPLLPKIVSLKCNSISAPHWCREEMRRLQSTPVAFDECRPFTNALLDCLETVCKASITLNIICDGALCVEPNFLTRIRRAYRHLKSIIISVLDMGPEPVDFFSALCVDYDGAASERRSITRMGIYLHVIASRQIDAIMTLIRRLHTESHLRRPRRTGTLEIYAPGSELFDVVLGMGMRPFKSDAEFNNIHLFRLGSGGDDNDDDAHTLLMLRLDAMNNYGDERSLVRIDDMRSV